MRQLLSSYFYRIVVPAASAAVFPAVACAGGEQVVDKVVVLGSQIALGIADAASVGTVTQRQLEARTVYRPGELLESVPGLVVSQHSGEGKAN